MACGSSRPGHYGGRDRDSHKWIESILRDQLPGQARRWVVLPRTVGLEGICGVVFVIVGVFLINAAVRCEP